MSTQTPNPQDGSNQFTAKDGTQLDPTAATLTRAIRQTESQGNYNAVGDKGTSKGAYQFNGDNFKAWAKQYGQNPDDFSPENQDKVAYARVSDLLKQGHTQSQVASIWNSGSPDYEGKKGHNAKLGLDYDVPAYVAKVQKAYQQQLSGQPEVANNKTSITGTNTAQASDGTQPEEQHSLLGKIMDFAFPIVNDIGNDFSGKSKKSALQQIGDAGLSALWFVPGVGEMTGAAIKGAGLLGEVGSRVAGHVIGGAATGYGADVAGNLANGETDAGKVLTPGLGTVTGGALGGLLGKVGSKYSKEGLVSDAAKSNNSVLGQTKRGANELADSFAEGKDTGKFLAQKGIHLPATVNPETVAFDTAQHAQNLRNDASTVNSTLTDALKVVPGSTTVTDLETELANQIRNKAPDRVTAEEQIQLVKDETNKWRSQYGENLSAADMNELKQRNWLLSKFDASKTNTQLKTHRVIGHSLKTSVEDLAKKGGLDGVGEMNEYTAQHLDAADALDRVNGSKAKGGRLGDLMQKHTLGAIGGVSGAFGGGPVGAIIGAMAGEYAGGKLSSVLRKIGASPIKSAMLKRMIQEDPAIVQKMIDYSKKTPQGLQALKEQLSKQGINILGGSTKKAVIAPKEGILSKIGKKSVTSGLITTGARTGAGFNSQTQ